jgi:hypothetical protein
MRIERAEDARCWWCSGSRQTVAHLLLECRKWRREREVMVQKLKAKDLTVSEMPARRNIEVLFADKATVDMLEFVQKTEVGKRPGAGNDKVDSWDVERLDQRDEEEEGVVENSGYRGEAAQQRQKSRRVLSPKAVAA